MGLESGSMTFLGPTYVDNQLWFWKASFQNFSKFQKFFQISKLFPYFCFLSKFFQIYNFFPNLQIFSRHFFPKISIFFQISYSFFTKFQFLSDGQSLLRVALSVRRYVGRSVCPQKIFQKVLKKRFCQSNRYET